MYTSRPSKQQEKKGMELMKKLISSQRRVKTMVFNNDTQNFQSQTSIQYFLNQSQETSISNQSHEKLSTQRTKKLKDMKKSTPQIQNVKNKSSSIQQDYLKLSKKNRQRIYSHNLSYEKQLLNTIQSKHYKKLSNFHRTMNNSLQSLNLLQIEDTPHQQFIRTESYLQPFLKSQHNLINRKKSIVLNSSSSKKLNNSSVKKLNILSPKLNKSKVVSESRFAKDSKLSQDLKVIQAKLSEQRQKIKEIRREFVDVLQESKTKTKQFDENMFQFQIREKQMQHEIQKISRQDTQRKSKLSSLIQQTQYLTNLVLTQRSSLQQKTKTLTENIINTQQTNSIITRKIYHLKQQLIQMKQSQAQLKKKQLSNKQLLKKLIRQEDKLNQLKINRQIHIQHKKQQIKQKLSDLLQTEDKKPIYDRLDKELNLIKEYYKISSSSKEFKRNIKKMTKYDFFIQQIKKNQSSPQYSEDIMNMYKRELWDIGMPRFLAEESMYIEAPQIRKLKNTLKQMELKRQNLNSILKEKQRLVNSLSFKSNKLTQQIQQMKQEQERRKEQQEVLSEIDWGF